MLINMVRVTDLDVAREVSTIAAASRKKATKVS